MSRIPDSFIDDLLRRVDIVDVVNRRVPLKRSGKEYSACCPFHDEKTPSFTVSEQKQFYHCFGCGAHGSAIRFLMEYDGLGFIDAVTDLAQLAGLEIPREAGESCCWRGTFLKKEEMIIKGKTRTVGYRQFINSVKTPKKLQRPRPPFLSFTSVISTPLDCGWCCGC